MAGIGLFGTMEMARNSLAVSRTAAEVTGHNLANASDPSYARQRIRTAAAPSLLTPQGPQGTGSFVKGFEQIRDTTLDKYLVSEKYLTGYYNSKLTTLTQAQARLGQVLDRQTVDPKSGQAGQTGLAERLTDFFNTFQSLAAAPTSNTERRLSIVSAQELADRFQRANERLTSLRTDINSEVTNATKEANRLLESISVISQRIGASESDETGSANELRDQRQAWFEELAEFTNFNTTEDTEGKMTLTISGHIMIKEDGLIDQLTTTQITNNPTAAQTGMTYVSSKSTGELLNVSSGKTKGLIDARDDTIYTILNEINKVAENLITEVNNLHVTGYDLAGNNENTLKFFTGTNASDIGVNQTLIANPQRVQASAYANEPGDNTIAKKIANLASKTITNLGSLTFNERYSNAVAQFGQAISNIETHLEAQESVERLLLKQRDMISGVSIDEEVSNLMIYQRAFQASSRLITTVDSLLADLLNMQR
ncbi:MAG: flagellar hook-associated protein FlgK [Verrucomicrobiales bacterium]|nr:flagellar hook-associated protein FlgK [Verrucomicrobiales bacterium]|tara:strand:- start:680 stop:2128 length:1449 start_codon:yes stop_codon:yes gene_type:complete